MSEQDKHEAREHLGRAARQGRHAAKNAGRAAQLGAEIAAEETVDALSHAATEVIDGVETVTGEVRTKAPRLSATGLAFLSSDLGIGFFATAVSLWSGTIAVHKFRSVIENRGMVTR